MNLWGVMVFVLFIPFLKSEANKMHDVSQDIRTNQNPLNQEKTASKSEELEEKQAMTVQDLLKKEPADQSVINKQFIEKILRDYQAKVMIEKVFEGKSIEEVDLVLATLTKLLDVQPTHRCHAFFIRQIALELEAYISYVRSAWVSKTVVNGVTHFRVHRHRQKGEELLPFSRVWQKSNPENYRRFAGLCFDYFLISSYQHILLMSLYGATVASHEITKLGGMVQSYSGLLSDIVSVILADTPRYQVGYQQILRSYERVVARAKNDLFKPRE